MSSGCKPAAELALRLDDAARAGHRREARIRTAGDSRGPPSRRRRRGWRRRRPRPEVDRSRCSSSCARPGRCAPSGRRRAATPARCWRRCGWSRCVSSDSSSSRWLAKAASIVSNALDSAGSRRAPSGGQPNPSALAHEQRRAHPLLEAFDLIGHGRLGHPELGRGGGEILGPRGRFESPDRGQRRKSSHAHLIKSSLWLLSSV